MNGIEVVCVLASEWMTYRKGYTANVEELHPTDLLECPQPTFLRYRLIFLLFNRIQRRDGILSLLF